MSCSILSFTAGSTFDVGMTSFKLDGSSATDFQSYDYEVDFKYDPSDTTSIIELDSTDDPDDRFSIADGSFQVKVQLESESDLLDGPVDTSLPFVNCQPVISYAYVSIYGTHKTDGWRDSFGRKKVAILK